MNWVEFWDKRGTLQGAAGQVGRVVNGQEMDEVLLKKIAQQIALQLDLKPTDVLLDVCCGNGALSKLLLPYCKEINGIDFSQALMEKAKKDAPPQIHFHCASALDFNLPQQFDKAVLYFSFQYFETYAEGKKVIANMLQHAKPGALLLIGDITDSRKFFRYYNSLSALLRWFKQKINKQNNMGKFWHPNELFKICEELGVKGQLVEQENWQPYAGYRFDFLISK